MYPEQKRLVQSFVALLVEKPSTSPEMDYQSGLLRGEEKNSNMVILRFLVLNNRLIGNHFFLLGITNILCPVVKTNVRSKIIRLAFYCTARGIE